MYLYTSRNLGQPSRGSAPCVIPDLAPGSKVYLAGKITGDPAYRKKFQQAAEKLSYAGYIVLDPAALPEGMAPKDYMRLCLAMIDVSDAAVFLPDAYQSKGAVIEYMYCRYIGKRTHFFSALTVGGKNEP